MLRQRTMFYKPDGTPIHDEPGKPACLVWGEYRDKHLRVCSTRFWWGGWLSTVYLGIDHNYGDGPPLIFESMLFGWRRGSDLDCQRYSTAQEAIAGHAELVAKYLNPWRVVPIWIWDWTWSYRHATRELFRRALKKVENKTE